MMRKHWPLLLLGTAFLCALGAWLVPRLEWKEVSERSGPRGEAASDPHYAMRMLLGRLGTKVTLVDDPLRLDDLPADSTLILDALLSEPVARRMESRLLAWVGRGGHLVVIVPGPEQSDRFTAAIGLERLGRHFGKSGEALRIGDRTLSVWLPACDVFSIRATPLWSATVQGYQTYRRGMEDADEEDEDEEDATPASKARRKSRRIDAPALAFAGWQHGKGRIAALCEDAFVDTARIGTLDHAELAVRVLLDDPLRPVFLAQSARADGLIDWLIDHAAAALAALLVLVVLVLWRAMPRLGPILPDPPSARPGLAVHLAAVGAFLLRRRAWELLLAPPREALRRRAAGFAPSGAASVAELARLAGIAPEALESALSEAPRNRSQYEQAAFTLGRVLDMLHARHPGPSADQEPKARLQ